ncbi:site-specific integrase [Sporosarcina aquimarina]|uniref:Site-specific integrase n=1 Tax=Sporosarcina aquimarina TaxID=114975 RepID=A0ABU4G180_9BACL|nr:site-specific integrase [Sporosarcina aquimarina]MDW0109417.1 site-specific integrase [Sporosarcina aquimarina]
MGAYERHYLTFLLAIYTGMRRGELLGLKWEDVDLNKRIIHVKRSLAYLPKSGYLLTTPKTRNSIRQIPIPQFVLKELIKHKKKQDEWRLLVGELYQEQDLVICTNTGSFQDPRNVIRVMKRLINKANVTEIRFHDIRHTHASILISEGVDVVKISARLGHANPKITFEYYAHLIPNTSSDVADVFHLAIQKGMLE